MSAAGLPTRVTEHCLSCGRPASAQPPPLGWRRVLIEGGAAAVPDVPDWVRRALAQLLDAVEDREAWLVFHALEGRRVSEGVLARVFGIDRLDVRDLRRRGRAIDERLRAERVARATRSIDAAVVVCVTRAAHTCDPAQRPDVGCFACMAGLDDEGEAPRG